MRQQLALTGLVAAGMLAAAGCDRDTTSQPNAQSPQSSTSRPAEGGPSGAPPPAGGGAQLPSSQAGVAAQTAFDTADRDKDGEVNATEASSVPGLNFAAADTDKNASLDRQEYMAAIALNRPPG
jgi:hypothetical protein